MKEPVETDAEPGLPPPRQTSLMFGHLAAEGELASALSGRGHHAWLITGPKGVGKATLAYRFARRLLGAAPAPGHGRPLDWSPTCAIAQHVASLTHPDLAVLRRGLNDRGKARREIAVDDVRALTGFFHLKAAEGGWRVAVVDAADDLNRSAANALLKTLEEPPARSALILISHAPGGLLPTIRSRCRRLRLSPTSDADVSAALKAAGQDADPGLVRLAGGRPGRALALAHGGGVASYGAFLDAIIRASRDHGQALQALGFARDSDPEDRLAAFLDQAQDWCRRAAVIGVDAPRQSEDPRADDAFTRMAPPERAGAWAHAWMRLSELRAQSEGLPLDPQHAYARAAAILAEAARAG